MKLVEDVFELTGIEHRKEPFGITVINLVLTSDKESQIKIQLTDEPLRVLLFDRYKVTIELMERLAK